MSQAKVEENKPELEWIQMKKDFDLERKHQEEGGIAKFKRKFYENPLVPIGCLATAGALSFGLYSFKKGEKKISQRMMRVRILAQGFTVAALMVGVFSTFNKSNESKQQ